MTVNAHAKLPLLLAGTLALFTCKSDDAGDSDGGGATETVGGSAGSAGSGSDASGGGSESSAGSDGSGGGSASGGGTGGATDSTGGSGGSGGTGGTAGSGGTAGASTSGSSAGTAGGTGGGGVDCGGKTYACGDGTDNDGDGFIDNADPECTGPCDDDEGTFQTGIPGDNMDCWQDCFFDGNSGHGDDGCRWNLKCDPLNPGANVGCEYTGANSCDSTPADTPEECINFCATLTPNGCDCFGCCTVDTPDGPRNIFLNSGPDCAIDNLDACLECTPNNDCGNPCEPEKCEVCFGQDAPPEGCDDPECPEGVQSCEILPDGTSTCPEDEFCLTGCCVPGI